MLHKFVKKAGPDLHIFLNSLVFLFAVIMILMVGYVVWKHLLLKSATYMFVQQAQIASKQRYVGATELEDAQILATTVAIVPTKNPLITQKDDLQKLVTAVSSQTGRYIVVMDTQQMILAGTIPANVGKKYVYGNNVGLQTLKDGVSRRFIETSMDYPRGIEAAIAPVRDTSGTIVGAVLMSASKIFAQ